VQDSICKKCSKITGVEYESCPAKDESSCHFAPAQLATLSDASPIGECLGELAEKICYEAIKVNRYEVEGKTNLKKWQAQSQQRKDGGDPLPSSPANYFEGGLILMKQETADDQFNVEEIFAAMKDAMSVAGEEDIDRWRSLCGGDSNSLALFLIECILHADDSEINSEKFAARYGVSHKVAAFLQAALFANCICVLSHQTGEGE
jgi:hypothetical protein